MIEIDPRGKMVRKALLVGAYRPQEDRASAEGLLGELEELVDTLGIPERSRLLVPCREMHARFLLGSGKAEELALQVKVEGYDSLIFDNELTPSQQRNWETLTGITVLDRQEVILDIFAQRAQTHEARLQIDLARLEYALPRLTRAWGHLVRQGGGIGAKGEGESQLEQDKRRVRVAIGRLKAELEKVRSARSTQRKDRKRAPVPNAAIVGYTNAGKSSLLKRLTGADVLVEDKLFATLDTTTRRIQLPNNQPLLLTDTVGFVRRLPHRLVEAFHATLEESVLSDFLVHVLDASQPDVLEFYETTLRVLHELGAEQKDTILVFNKVDKLCDESVLGPLRARFPEAHFVSVHTGKGLDSLMEHMAEKVSSTALVCFLRIPLSDGASLAKLHRAANILEMEYEDEGVRVTATLSPRMRAEFGKYLIEEAAKNSVS